MVQGADISSNGRPIKSLWNWGTLGKILGDIESWFPAYEPNWGSTKPKGGCTLGTVEAILSRKRWFRSLAVICIRASWIASEAPLIWKNTNFANQLSKRKKEVSYTHTRKKNIEKKKEHRQVKIHNNKVESEHIRSKRTPIKGEGRPPWLCFKEGAHQNLMQGTNAVTRIRALGVWHLYRCCTTELHAQPQIV